MAIEIKETFTVQAPIDVVWQFVTDPARVVTCMPGAQLVEQVDDSQYIGSVKIKLGAISTSYKGRVAFTSVDEQARTIQLSGEGRETGGGTAKGAVDIHLESLPDGQTQMSIEARVDLTGKVMQVGRGMIKGVSHQLFRQFAASARQRLETSAESDSGEATTAPGAQEDTALAVAPLLARTLWAAIVRFFRRLFGGGAS